MAGYYYKKAVHKVSFCGAVLPHRSTTFRSSACGNIGTPAIFGWACTNDIACRAWVGSGNGAVDDFSGFMAESTHDTHDRK